MDHFCSVSSRLSGGVVHAGRRVQAMEGGKRSQAALRRDDSISSIVSSPWPPALCSHPLARHPHLSSLRANAGTANHLQLIDSADIRALVRTLLAVADLLIKEAAVHINKDLTQNPLWLLGFNETREAD